MLTTRSTTTIDTYDQLQLPPFEGDLSSPQDALATLLSVSCFIAVVAATFTTGTARDAALLIAAVASGADAMRAFYPTERHHPVDAQGRIDALRVDARCRAIRNLAHHSEAVVGIANDLRHDPHHFVRCEAADALGHHVANPATGTTGLVIDALADALRYDTDHHVRTAAAAALARTTDMPKAAFQALARAVLRDPYWEVRRHAARGLGADVPSLVALICYEDNHDVADELLKAIANDRHGRALRLLRSIANDSEATTYIRARANVELALRDLMDAAPLGLPC